MFEIHGKPIPATGSRSSTGFRCKLLLDDSIYTKRGI